MFYDRFVQLCSERGVSPSRAAVEAGLSKSTVSKWKTTPDSKPTGAAIAKMTQYFNISISELMGEPEEKTPVLTEKDRRDIASDIENIMQQLDSSGDLMFDGNPMSDEARESIRSALHIGLELAKTKNKERFTPKKYRKE